MHRTLSKLAIVGAAYVVIVGFTLVITGQPAPKLTGQPASPHHVGVVDDWSFHHLIYPNPGTYEQVAKDPAAYAKWLTIQYDTRFILQQIKRGAIAVNGLQSATGGTEDLAIGSLQQLPVGPIRLPLPPLKPKPTPEPAPTALKRDWAVSLGAGGVAQGMLPAKYTFNTNLAPSCTADFVVFPVNASTGNTRANVIGTFSTTRASGTGSVKFTVTPTVGTAVTLTLTASTTVNTGTDFEVSTTAGTTGADANATNLAAAINRNLTTTILDRIVAVASANTVTVYTLTPGTRVVLTVPATVTRLTWGTVTAGTNGAQANIVAFNQLYSGSGTPLCTGLTYPEFIFSYASGVGPVATSPALSLSGTETSYVENDPNIGAILHVLTFGSGSTEHGTCTNSGTALPTCATAPVIPGSTANSTATDFMLPLGLVAANAATGVAGAADSFSSPFTDYFDDTTYVGDNNGYLYAITPTFLGTPAYGAHFPVQVSATSSSVTPTAVTATTTVVTVTATNTLVLGEMVTISGVTADTGNDCSAADAAAINGTQMVLATGLSGTAFEFDATIPEATTGTGCTVTGATVTPGSNFLSSPVVDVAGTGNIFVGDSSSNLYELTSAGATAATALSLGDGYGTVNGGIRDGPIIDSTNAVGYVVQACNGDAVGETYAENAGLFQFKFTSNTLTEVADAALDTAAQQNCTVAGYSMYDPQPDERYYVLGIGNATAANNGELIETNSGTGGVQIKPFSFVNSALQTTPLDKPQVAGPAISSPVTEFFNSQVSTVTVVTATTTVVTVTATNTLAVNDMVTISGVTANTGNGCTAADVTTINSIQTVASATGTGFTFDATIGTATTGAGCTVSGATASGGPDYMFFGTTEPDMWSFLLPSGAESGTDVTTNTTDVTGGTSGIVVDNNSTSGQASSLYFGTLATSTTICGTTAAYCAVKLTQSALQ